eukprot:3423809-Heterocapsa_arctica.AAC.1
MCPGEAELRQPASPSPGLRHLGWAPLGRRDSWLREVMRITYKLKAFQAHRHAKRTDSKACQARRLKGMPSAQPK